MKCILHILFLTTSMFAQPVDFKVNGRQTNIYNDAILHYVDSAHKKTHSSPDTLFILKNEELTGNIIQSPIQKTKISFQDSMGIAKRLLYHTSIKALNIVSDQNSGKDQLSIQLISFIISRDKGYKPFENCRIKYIYNSSKKEFEFSKITCGNY